MIVSNARGVLVLIAMFSGVAARGLPANIDLLYLVPAESQMIAGAGVSPHHGHRGEFLLFTRANTLDLEDFFSISGVDISHEIRQLILTAAAGPDAASPEHGLLVSGRFDAERIYKSAEPERRDYRGEAMAVIHPFERERDVLRQDRLLAIIDSRLAIFGTEATVREEIDRFLDRTPADALISQKLSLLRSEDETWCLVSSLALNPEVARVFSELDSALSGVGKSDSLLFGIRYRKRIEIEILTDPVFPTQRGQAHLLAGSMLRSEDDAVAAPKVRVVRIEKRRYDRWLEKWMPH